MEENSIKNKDKILAMLKVASSHWLSKGHGWEGKSKQASQQGCKGGCVSFYN